MTDYSKLDDQQLTDLLRAGNQFAFKELYNRYWNVLLDTAYKRLNSIGAAEEVVQELFVNLFVKRENLEIRSSLEAYLKTALKYKFLMFSVRNISTTVMWTVYLIKPAFLV